MTSTPGQPDRLSEGSIVDLSTPCFSCGHVFCRGGFLFALKSEVESLAYLIHGWNQQKANEWIQSTHTIFHSVLFDIPFHSKHYTKNIFNYLKTEWICISDINGNLFGVSTTYFAQNIHKFEAHELPSYGLEIARNKTAHDDWPAFAMHKKIRYLSGLDEDDTLNECDLSQVSIYDNEFMLL